MQIVFKTNVFLGIFLVNASPLTTPACKIETLLGTCNIKMLYVYFNITVFILNRFILVLIRRNVFQINKTLKYCVIYSLPTFYLMQTISTKACGILSNSTMPLLKGAYKRVGINKIMRCAAIYILIT